MAEPTPSWPNEQRAAHYRAQAQSLRDMADGEAVGGLRESLVDLAEQYDRLAVSIEAKGKDRP